MTKKSIGPVTRKLSRKILFVLGMTLFISGCATFRQRNNFDNLTGTKWLYSDKDWTYEVYFKKNGKLLTTHPNDKTKGNDYWEQSNTTVDFYYNDKYSIYNGKQVGQDTIVGIGRNQNDTWEFRMTKK